MKKLVLVAISVLLVFIAAGSVLAAKTGKGVFDAKAGDTIYVCGCGAGCDCGTLAKKEGKCSCGNDLVKTTVTKVEGGKVYYQLDGKELSAPARGKYVCGCKGCDCGTVSQKPGKCGCGQDLDKVKE
jgi:hypothetical protein